MAPAGEVRARAAYDFVNAIGVNSHFAWGTSPYRTRFAEAKAALGELGVRHLRDHDGNSAAKPFYRDLSNALGVRLTAMIDERTGSGAGQRLAPSRIAGRLAEARTQLGTRILAGIEGPNEYNLLERDYRHQGWVGELRAYQAELYRQVKADSVLRTVPVLAPTMGGPNHNYYAYKLGNISASITHGAAHIYPNWYPFERQAEDVLLGVRANAPGRPVWATETGWHQATNSGAMWLSDDALTKYLVRGMASFASHPTIRRGHFYQLVDSTYDPGKTRTAGHFGLLDYSMRRKPSFYAVRNMMHVMCDNPLGFAPQSLRYTLSGNLNGVRSLLFQKRNRAFYFLIWQEKQVFERGRPIINPPQAVNIRFEQGISQVRAYQPSVLAGITSGNLPKRTYAQPAAIDLSVTDGMTVLEIVPSGTGVPPVSTSCNFAAF